MAERIRVLHVVGSLVAGGVETWLMHVLRNIDRERIQMDFLVHSDQPAPYDHEARGYGARILPCIDTQRPDRYSRTLRGIIREHGPYQVVHSHVDRFSGIVMRAAAREGVPVRITHSHLDTRRANTGAGLLRRGYLALMGAWIQRYSTVCLAASDLAGKALFEKRWPSDPRMRVLYCGIDTTPFHRVRDRGEIERSLGLPAGKVVVGHVGAFRPQKNHDLVVRIAAEVVARDLSFHFLLVGDGALLDPIKQQAIDLGIGDHIVFAGQQPDVPGLMTSVMDSFLFPSLFEGLPLALLEAQAAGLPCLVSEEVTPEVDVVPGLIHRLPLNAPVSTWADHVLALRQSNIPPRAAALSVVEASSFSIEQSIAALEQVYAGA